MMDEKNILENRLRGDGQKNTQEEGSTERASKKEKTTKSNAPTAVDEEEKLNEVEPKQ